MLVVARPSRNTSESLGSLGALLLVRTAGPVGLVYLLILPPMGLYEGAMSTLYPGTGLMGTRSVLRTE